MPPWLRKFAVSLAWRACISDIDRMLAEYIPMVPFIEARLNEWRAFLLGEVSEPGPSKHHLFFLEAVAESRGVALPDMMDSYALRSVDQFIAASSDEAYAYTKLPGLIFWSGIQPPSPEGWQRTLIEAVGSIGSPQFISQPGFGPFFLEQAKGFGEVKSKMSERQRRKIHEAFLANRDKALVSQSFEIFLAKLRRDLGNR
jgi:hypothetical protein